MSSIGDFIYKGALGWRPRLGRLVAQYLKFGLVGIAATVTHVIVFTLWIEAAGLTPLRANVAAFCVATIVGFIGHFSWTFHGHGAREARRWQAVLVKFVVVSLSGLALNSLMVYFVVNVLAMSYVYAVGLMVTVVPACTFVLSKFWAFT